MTLEPIVRGGHIVYEVPDGYKKDRATALVLALKGWDNLDLSAKQIKKTTSLPTGSWVSRMPGQK